jgi:hypothetical protein
METFIEDTEKKRKKECDRYYKIECISVWDEVVTIEIRDGLVEIKRDKRVDVIVKTRSKGKRLETIINTTK